MKGLVLDLHCQYPRPGSYLGRLMVVWAGQETKNDSKVWCHNAYLVYTY